MEENKNKNNIKTVISIVSLIVTIFSLIGNVYQYNKNHQLEERKFKLEKYKALEQSNIKKQDEKLNDLQSIISKTEELYDKVQDNNVELTSDQKNTISDEQSKIFNQLTFYINFNNKYGNKLYEITSAYLDYIKMKISNADSSPKNIESGKSLYPQTGSLPELEKIYIEYQNEEKLLIKQSIDIKLSQ